MTMLGFPGNPLPIRSEMFISGAWVDITSRVRLANEIVISGRGRANEQGRPSPCTCDFTLNNTDGLFNNRNPSSIYFGKLPRNLPVRHSVTEDRSFAIYDSLGATRVKTTDKASLDIVGDIDIRVEFELDNFPGANVGSVLAAKYRRSTPNRSWLFSINRSGYLQLNWSTDGVSAPSIASVVPITTVGPIAARVTVDVDNGAGNSVFTFYTSDTIAGTWTQLGGTLTLAGTTSFFSSAAELELGRIDDGQNGGVADLTGLVGRIYGFELRSGIGGTVVANAAIYSQARGTTSWSDGLAAPNTWTTNGNVEITPDDRRFTGELSALPQVWDPSGRDVYVPVQAADVTRRLGKGAVTATSPLRGYFSALSTSTGYWTAEEGTQATTLTNIAPRGKAGLFSDITFTVPTDLPATKGAVQINSTATRIYLTGTPTANNSFACFNWAMKFGSLPASLTTAIDLIGAGGSVGRVNMSIGPTTIDLAAYGNTGTLLASNSTGVPSQTPVTGWNLYRIQMQQVGGNVQLDIGWYHPGDNTLYGAGPLTFAGTVGKFNKGIVTGTTQNIGTQYCHFFMGQFFLDNGEAGYVPAASAFAGETTVARFARVATANGIAYQIIGATGRSERMGPQPNETPLDILYQCSDTEGGQVYPDRNSPALILRTRRSLVNQYGPQIDYAAKELGPDVPLPIDDDSLLRNSVTATRPDGSTGFAFQDTGPNSTALPTATPPGVGVVPGQIFPNPYLNDRLNDMAEQDVFLGTWDEPRWPLVMVELSRPNYTGTATKVRKGHILARLDIGDMYSITNPPAGWLAPDEIKLMMQGVKEVLGNGTWRFYWNTSPYGPFILNDHTSTVLPGNTNSRYRVAASTHTITAGFTASATGAAVFQITTPTGSTLWGTTASKPGNFPMNVVVAGEVITLSGITGTTSPQTANVSARNVNGLLTGKAHLAGESIQVQYPFYVGL